MFKTVEFTIKVTAEVPATEFRKDGSLLENVIKDVLHYSVINDDQWHVVCFKVLDTEENK